MVRAFQTEISGVSFQFNPINISKPFNYQVYVSHEGKIKRFHMQRNGGTFEITDPNNCPKEYRVFELQLSEAIVQSISR